MNNQPLCIDVEARAITPAAHGPASPNPHDGHVCPDYQDCPAQRRLLHMHARHEALSGFVAQRLLPALDCLLMPRCAWGKDDDINDATLMTGEHVLLTAGLLRQLRAETYRALLGAQLADGEGR